MSPTGFEPDDGVRAWQTLVGISANPEASDAASPDPRRPSAENTVTLSHELIEKALEEARSSWIRSGDTAALRNALLELLRRLEDRE